MDNAKADGTTLGELGLAGHMLTLPFYQELEGARPHHSLTSWAGDLPVNVGYQGASEPS